MTLTETLALSQMLLACIGVAINRVVAWQLRRYQWERRTADKTRFERTALRTTDWTNWLRFTIHLCFLTLALYSLQNGTVPYQAAALCILAQLCTTAVCVVVFFGFHAALATVRKDEALVVLA